MQLPFSCFPGFSYFHRPASEFHPSSTVPRRGRKSERKCKCKCKDLEDGHADVGALRDPDRGCLATRSAHSTAGSVGARETGIVRRLEAPSFTSKICGVSHQGLAEYCSVLLGPAAGKRSLDDAPLL